MQVRGRTKEQLLEEVRSLQEHLAVLGQGDTEHHQEPKAHLTKIMALAPSAIVTLPPRQNDG